MEIIYIVGGILVGAIVAWLLAKSTNATALQTEKDAATQKYSELEKEWVSYKAISISQLQTAQYNLDEKIKEILGLKQIIQSSTEEIAHLNNQFSIASANFKAANQTIIDKKIDFEAKEEELRITKNELNQRNQSLATATANNTALNEKMKTQKDEMEAMGKKFNTEFENIANKIGKLCS